MKGKPTIEKTGFIVAIGICSTVGAIVDRATAVVHCWLDLGVAGLFLARGLRFDSRLSPAAEIPLMAELSRRIHAYLESIR